MLYKLQEAEIAAINASDQKVRAIPDIAVQSVVQSDSEFFSSACKQVFGGKDAGLQLHLATGVNERSCYRYAAGEREVPVLVLRSLLHSEQGEPFLAALMHGCTAPWWNEFHRHARIGAAVVYITKRENE